MSNRRAENRRAARGRARQRADDHFRHHDEYPILPGVIPELTDEMKERAMAQAHEDLPPMAGTRVSVLFYGYEEGVAALRELDYDDEKLNLLRDHSAEALAGPDPHIVIAMRIDR